MPKMYQSPKNNPYYKPPGIPVHQGPRAEAHFYPTVTDAMLKSDKYNIDWVLSYADCLKKINNLEDVHTTQMAFCNPRTAETHDCYIHKINVNDNTQEIGLVGFDSVGDIKIQEWV